MNLKKIRKKFVKDYKLPIPVLSSPYFEYFLDLYEEEMSSKTDYEKFIALVDSYGYETFMEVSDNLIQSAIAHVKAKESYQSFIKEDFKKYSERYRTPDAKTNLYSSVNVGRSWISVDFKQANFHALKQYDMSIVDDANTYEEWLCQFPNGENFTHLKTIRQVIFGNLNPKRQQSIEAYYLQLFLKQVVSNVGEDIEVVIASNDEVLFAYDENLSIELDTIIQEFQRNTKFKLVKGIFELERFKDAGFIKNYTDGNSELVGVNKHIFAQVYKDYKGLPKHDWDKLFVHEGMLSTFIDSYDD